MKRIALILLLMLVASFAGATNTKDSIQVAASADDAFRSLPLEEVTITLTDTNIMIGQDLSGAMAGAFRFINWKILRNATIDSAFFRWLAGTTSTTTPVWWAFYGEDTASATTFTTADFLSRNLTTATVAESILATTAGAGYRSKNIGSIIQEIVNRADWPNDSTGDIGIFVKGDASGANKYRRIRTYDKGSTLGAMLIIYSNPPVAEPADITHTIAKVGQTKTTITNEDTYSGGVGVDTVWMFYDDDATIAGADSTYDASSLGSPDTITATSLTAGTEYHCWFVISEDNGRDTSAVFHDTTMGEIAHTVTHYYYTTSHAISLQDEYSGGINVDTVWLFWDDDATIAGADSTFDATDLGTPDSILIENLVDQTIYRLWFVISEDYGRDTSAVFTDTTGAKYCEAKTHDLTMLDTAYNNVLIEDIYNPGNLPDSFIVFYDDDATIAGADSLIFTEALDSPFIANISGLLPETEYNVWIVSVACASRDTSDAIVFTTGYSYTPIGSSTVASGGYSPLGIIRTTAYIASVTGWVDSLNANISNSIANRKWKMMIYKRSDSSLVGTSTERQLAVQTSIINQWVFPTPVPVTGGQRYYLAIWADATGGGTGSVRYANVADTVEGQTLTYGTAPAKLTLTTGNRVPSRRIAIWGKIRYETNGLLSGYLSTKAGIGYMSYKGGICYRNRR